MRRFRRHLFLLLLLPGTWLPAQNLVPNPSFEDTLSLGCDPFINGEFGQRVQNWYAPSSGTPDHYTTLNPQSCWNHQPNSTYPGPICLKGPQMPRTGDGMAGMFLYTIATFEDREYVQVHLSSPLEVCQRYAVEFYVSLAEFTEFGTNRLGAHLSVGPVIIGTSTVITATPQVNAQGLISDTQNWVRIADTITADQPYDYLTFGNFFSDAVTQLVANPTSSGLPGCYGAYYYLDDVSVERICPQVAISGATTLCLGDSTPLSLSGVTCYDSLRWSTGETATSITVKDGGNYFVTVWSDSCVSTDSLHLEVTDCPPMLEMGNVFSPNGDGLNDLFLPVTAQALLNAELLIYDRWGRQLWSTRDMGQGWDGKISGKDCPEGVYYYTVRYQGKDLKLAQSSGALTLLR
ncbi:MAG: gliding motility-associated C-terminal domain-containing protein [Bacteroidia bacterium]